MNLLRTHVHRDALTRDDCMHPLYAAASVHAVHSSTRRAVPFMSEPLCSRTRNTSRLVGGVRGGNEKSQRRACEMLSDIVCAGSFHSCINARGGRTPTAASSIQPATVVGSPTMTTAHTVSSHAPASVVLRCFNFMATSVLFSAALHCAERHSLGVGCTSRNPHREPPQVGCSTVAQRRGRAMITAVARKAPRTIAVPPVGLRPARRAPGSGIPAD